MRYAVALLAVVFASQANAAEDTLTLTVCGKWEGKTFMDGSWKDDTMSAGTKFVVVGEKTTDIRYPGGSYLADGFVINMTPTPLGWALSAVSRNVHQTTIDIYDYDMVKNTMTLARTRSILFETGERFSEAAVFHATCSYK